MGATIHYRKLSGKVPVLPVDAPQSFLEAMRRAFGDEHRITLGPNDAQTVRGIRAGAGKTNEQAYDKLIEMLDDGETVEIWAEY